MLYFGCNNLILKVEKKINQKSLIDKFINSGFLESNKGVHYFKYIFKTLIRQRFERNSDHKKKYNTIHISKLNT